MHLYDETQKLRQQFATGVSCDGVMEQRLIIASRDVLGYMNALHAKVVKSKNTVMESFQDNFASLVQQLLTLFMQENAAVSKSVDDSRCETFNRHRRSISECEAVAKCQFDRLVRDDRASLETSAAVSKADRKSAAKWESGAGPSK